jgi:hypothetical protein
MCSVSNTMPVEEVLKYLRANSYKTYIVTGGGQDFVRVYAERVYGIPPEQKDLNRSRLPQRIPYEPQEEISPCARCAPCT